MLKCLKNADGWKKQEFLQQVLLLVQPVLKHCPATMQRNFTQMLLQRYFVQKSALCRR